MWTAFFGWSVRLHFHSVSQTVCSTSFSRKRQIPPKGGNYKLPTTTRKTFAIEKSGYHFPQLRGTRFQRISGKVARGIRPLGPLRATHTVATVVA